GAYRALERGAQGRRRWPAAPPVRSSDSFRRQRVHFDFLPAIQRAQAAAFGVAAHVPGFHAFAGRDAAPLHFEIFAVRPDAETGGIVGVVVIQSGDAGLELGVVGNLNDDILHGLHVT